MQKDSTAQLEVPSVDKQTYQTLANFLANEMVRQLEINHAKKGNRDNWLKAPLENLLLGLHYDVGKLQIAAFEKDKTRMLEYAADIANMALMVVDKFGLLPETKKKFSIKR